jgi:hypothetical protein
MAIGLQAGYDRDGRFDARVLFVSRDSERLTVRIRWLGTWALIAVVLVSIVLGLGFFATLTHRPMTIRADPASVRQTPPPKSVEDALAPIQGATGISREGGAFESFWLAYVLKKKYPASDVTQQISTRLKKLGWRLLQVDWLNPGQRLPQVPEWFEFTEEIPGTTPLHVDQWTAQWENDAGDLIDYTFRYSYPKAGTPDRRTLSVSAGWYPAGGKRQMQQLVQEARASEWKRSLPAWLRRWL